MEAGTIFIPTEGGVKFHKDYTLVLHDFPEAIRPALCQARTSKEHRRVFDLVKRTNHSDLEDLDTDTLLEFFRTEATKVSAATPGVIRKTVKKPTKFLSKLEVVAEDDVEVMNALASFEDAVMKIADPASPGSESAELFLVAQVPKIRSAFEATGKLVKRLYGTVAANKDSAENSMVDVFSRLETNLSEVHAVLGDFEHQESKLQDFGFDVSSALGGLANGLCGVQEVLGLASEDESPPKKRTKLTEQIDALELRIAKVQKLAEEGLGSLFQKVAGDKAAEGGAAAEQVQRTLDEVLFELGGVKTSLAVLERKEASVPSGSGYQLGGHSFGSVEEATLMLLEVGENGNDPGYFFDCFSVANWSVQQEKTMTDTLQMKALTQSSGLAESSHGLSVLMSFKDSLPVFVGEGKDVTKDLPLPLVKTFDEWYHPGRSTRTILSRYDRAHDALEKHLAGFYNTTCRVSARNLPLWEIGSVMLSKSKKFVQEMSRQVEHFRNRLLEDGSTPEEAWLLIGQMLNAVFGEIYKARTPFGESLHDHTDRTHRCALALVGTFRAHEKMEEIWMANFFEHPCVTTSLLLHLFSNKASSNTLAGIAERQDKLDSQLKAFQKTVQSQLDVQKRLVDAKAGAAKKAAA